MKEYVDGILAGIFIGALLVIAIMYLGDNVCTRGITALELCEKDLPRDEYCKLTGVK